MKDVDFSHSKPELYDAILEEVDNHLLSNAPSEGLGLLNGLGGPIIYFANRFLQTKTDKYSEYAIELLEKLIAKANSQELPTLLSIASQSVAPCWIIDYLIQIGILDESEKSNSAIIANYVRRSMTDINLSHNLHDQFFGYIGQALILLEHDRVSERPYVNRAIQALRDNIVQFPVGSFWNTRYPYHPSDTYEQTINLGIPHGGCGIILFLLKCCEVYKLHDQLKDILERAIHWIYNRLLISDYKLLYMYSSMPSSAGKLGWCYGDLSISYTLARYYEVFGDERIRNAALVLLERTSSKSLIEAGIMYWEKYDYYDTRICHGTSSVAYMYKKIGMIFPTSEAPALAERWIELTIGCLRNNLPKHFHIALDDNCDIDTSSGFLNGLAGTGLALISFSTNGLTAWDKLLLLDRPYHE